MKIQHLLRGLALLMATLSLESVVAQEKLFQDAMKEGRQPGRFYVAHNDKGKGISPEKMKQYAREHYYLVGDYHTRTVDKFGDKSIAVSSFEFLPPSEYSKYVFENITGDSGGSSGKYAQRGSAYLFSSTNFGSDYFHKVNGILWTGEVVDGMLNGMGEGFAQISAGRSVASGTDYTRRVSTRKEDWHAKDYAATTYAPAVNTADGRTDQKMCEVYAENTTRTGELMYQTITGLDNGDYVVELYANALYTSGRGFSSSMSDGATDVVCLKANNSKYFIKARIGSSVSQNGGYYLNTKVTDGTLRISMVKEKPGTNWHCIQIKSLKKGAAASTASKESNNTALDGNFNYGEPQLFVYFKGTFQNGFPQGEVNFKYFNNNARVEAYNSGMLTSESTTVGDFVGGYASFNNNNAYGFIDQQGTVVIPPTYESVLKGFQNGRAEVVSEGKEIVIDTKGTFLDHTAKQKRLIAAEKAEAERKAQAEKQAALEKKIAEEKAAVERQRAAEEAERRRIEKFRHAQPGDKVYYSQDFTHTESFLLFFSHSTGYSMAVVCFVEQNVNNGERLQIRVGSVKSSNSSYYSTPVIDGIEYHKGDVLWIKPLNDKRWQIE